MAVYILVGDRWCDRERSYLTLRAPVCSVHVALRLLPSPSPPNLLYSLSFSFCFFSQHVLLSSALNSYHRNHSSSSSSSLSHPAGTGLLSALQEPLAHGKHHCCHLRLGGVGRVMGVGRDGEDEWWKTSDTAVIVREEKTCRRVKYRLPESRTLNYSEECGSW